MQKMSDSELRVMGIIWTASEKGEAGPALQETMDAYNDLYRSPQKLEKLKPQTISTFLSRLCKKGFLNTERKGRYTLYTPAVSRNDYRTAVLDEEMSLLFGEKAGQVLTAIRKF